LVKKWEPQAYSSAYPIKTDIDKLHQVCLGELKGRHCGKTFASCYDVIGEIYNETKRILCIVEVSLDISRIHNMLIDLLIENDLQYSTVTMTTIKVHKSNIEFTSNYDLKKKLIGQYDQLLIYMK